MRHPHRAFDDHQWLAIEVARLSADRVRPGGTLLFMGGTADRSRGPDMSFIAAATAAMSALIANLAVEIALVRVNLIAPGFVDTPPRSRSAAWSGRPTSSPSQSTS